MLTTVRGRPRRGATTFRQDEIPIGIYQIYITKSTHHKAIINDEETFFSPGYLIFNKSVFFAVKTCTFFEIIMFGEMQGV